jgi:hypothetical protein
MVHLYIYIVVRGSGYIFSGIQIRLSRYINILTNDALELTPQRLLSFANFLTQNQNLHTKTQVGFNFCDLNLDKEVGFGK